MAHIIGTSGNDVLISTTTNTNDLIEGLDGNDILDGGAGNDILNCGNGNDGLIGGAGTDTLIGGQGDDEYLVEDSTDIVSIIKGVIEAETGAVEHYTKIIKACDNHQGLRRL